MRGDIVVRCRAWIIAIASVLAASIVATTAQSQSQTNRQTSASVSRFAQYRDAINENVVTIISGNPNGGFLYTAYDIAAVLERTSKMRVIPIVGKGGAQNVKDVLYLKGIDMGIMHPHVIQYFKQTGEVGPNLEKRIAYITTLFTDELHVVTRPDIKDFRDLEGKRVNFSNTGSGTQISMRLIFQALGMKVQEFNMGQGDAFELMKQGKLDATTCTCAKPLRSVRGLKKATGFKLLPVPYAPELEKSFLPGILTHTDYPELIPPGQSINTVAVQTILGVYNWKTKTTDRYRRVSRFVEAFFSNIKEFRKPPRQPKWKSINIAATVAGMTRFAPAQEWLELNAASSRLKTTGIKIDKNLARRQAARAAPNSPAEQEKLFRQFLKWVQGRPNKR